MPVRDRQRVLSAGGESPIRHLQTNQGASAPADRGRSLMLEAVVMTSWLVDDPSLVYLILGIPAVALAAGWWLTRRRGYLVGLGSVAGLLVLVWLLSHWIDSDVKRIDRSLRAMAAGVEAGNADAVFEHVSKDFHLGALDKIGFRRWAEGYIRGGQVLGIEIWDVQAKDVSRSRRAGTVVFKVKAKGEMTHGFEFYNCRAQYVLDPDGSWRLKGFRLYPPQTDPDQGEALPLPFEHP
jgi:hypothetical protein